MTSAKVDPDELDRLYAAATPHWRRDEPAHRPNDGHEWLHGRGWGGFARFVTRMSDGGPTPGDQGPANVEFAVKVHNAYPALAREVRAGRVLLPAIRALLAWESQPEVRAGARLHRRMGDVAAVRNALAVYDAAMKGDKE